MKKTVLIFMLLSCLFLLALPRAYAQVGKVAGEVAADFTLKDLSGREVTLSSFRGRPVILNFWATWCPYCRQERASLKSLYQEYREKDLVIVSVSIDSSLKAVKKYMEQNTAPYIVLTDTEGTAAGRYNVMSLPTTYLISRDGKIIRKFMGMVNWTDANIREYVDKLTERK
ncbi:MAG: TlpA family protein disulfide reductase [Nitrospirae bacterium]|nr:TlpA family protein disulfide reductase [Nitrospirota bacterium]